MMPKNEPEILTVPPKNYIAVSGQGVPNEARGACQRAVGVFFTLVPDARMPVR